MIKCSEFENMVLESNFHNIDRVRYIKSSDEMIDYDKLSEEQKEQLNNAEVSDFLIETDDWTEKETLIISVLNCGDFPIKTKEREDEQEEDDF